MYLPKIFKGKVNQIAILLGMGYHKLRSGLIDRNPEILFKASQVLQEMFDNELKSHVNEHQRRLKEIDNYLKQ
jgi:hypothetical protein